ncbi:MAG TPA: outer membrane lipoprotein chaperone LolA [Bacteroidota bacterium]|nr:outer membrane lipoprotein chaperone LolA [Bacteroidota bacterium]
MSLNAIHISVLLALAWIQPGITVQEITEKMQRRYEMIDDATAEFTQHVKFGFSKIEQSFAGTLKMKKPNKYRIESEYQTLVTDGKTVWAYSPVNHQVLVDRFKENQNSVSLETFVLNIPAAYYASLLGQETVGESKLYTLKLVPKDDRSFVKSVKVWVEEGRWVVHKVSIVDVNETETTYTIKNVKLNSHLSDTTFSFIPPPETEVVDLRQ